MDAGPPTGLRPAAAAPGRVELLTFGPTHRPHRSNPLHLLDHCCEIRVPIMTTACGSVSNPCSISGQGLRATPSVNQTHGLGPLA